MIKTRNQGEILAEMGINGSQSATPGSAGYSDTFVVPFNCRLKAVFARLGVAGVTGTQTTDLLLNGVTQVSSGTLLSFATTATSPTYSANLSPNPPVYTKGQILRLVNTGIHSGTAAIDLSVILVLERSRSQSWDDPVQFDTLGADSDAIC